MQENVRPSMGTDVMSGAKPKDERQCNSLYRLPTLFFGMWQTSLARCVREALAGHSKWQRIVQASPRLHLAVLVEPYLSQVMSGEKTVESRFSKTRRDPYRRVKPGEIIILKRSAGPVVGACLISEVWFYRLDQATLAAIKERFVDPLAAKDEKFWADRGQMRYATLMRVSHPTPLENIVCKKKDQRGWVTLPAERAETLHDTVKRERSRTPKGLS